MNILLILDTSGIQFYLFSSNELRHNIGASYLVKQSTTAWVNYHAHNSKGKVLYCGGGNATVLFEDQNEAEAFLKSYTTQLWDEARGLNVASHIENIENDNIAKALLDGFSALAKKKKERTSSLPLPALSITKTCYASGQPATAWIDKNTIYASKSTQQPSRFQQAKNANSVLQKAKTDLKPVSEEVWHKIMVTRRMANQDSAANEDLLQICPLQPEYAFPMDFDEMGRSMNEHSYVGVVHSDGDGMGKYWIEAIKALVTANLGTENTIKVIQELSEIFDNIGKFALKDILKWLQGEIVEVDGNRFVKGNGNIAEIELKPKKSVTGTFYLPFRPIVYGGDDLTFVCDGRIAMELTTRYMASFQKHATQELTTLKVKYPQIVSEFPDSFTASAGVAFVKTHHPFSRSYQLAENLTKFAKNYKSKEKIDDGCLDWQKLMDGRDVDLSTMREQEYQSQGAHLTLRPVALVKNRDVSIRNWAFVQKTLETLYNEWSEKRSKLKTLLMLHRKAQNRVQVEALLEDFWMREKARGSNQKPFNNHAGTHYATWFDALEMMDDVLLFNVPEASENPNNSETI